MIGISQLVGMIPEGLPVAMTIALAVGVQRMARRRAVVRRLAAVETLGSTTVICTRQDRHADAQRDDRDRALPARTAESSTVTGAGYAPEGAFLAGRRARSIRERRSDAAARCSRPACCATTRSSHGPSDAEPRWRPIGDPTEVALLTLGDQGRRRPRRRCARAAPRRAEIPFDPAAQMMATQHEHARRLAASSSRARPRSCSSCARGGASGTATRSRSTTTARRAMRDAAERMARARAARARGRRRRAMARSTDARASPRFAGRATLLGLVGQIDPPRPEVTRRGRALSRGRDPAGHGDRRPQGDRAAPSPGRSASRATGDGASTARSSSDVRRRAGGAHRRHLRLRARAPGAEAAHRRGVPAAAARSWR